MVVSEKVCKVVLVHAPSEGIFLSTVAESIGREQRYPILKNCNRSSVSCFGYLHRDRAQQKEHGVTTGHRSSHTQCALITTIKTL